MTTLSMGPAKATHNTIQLIGQAGSAIACREPR